MSPKLGAITDRMAERVLQNNGRIHCNATVEKINVENDRVKSVVYRQDGVLKEDGVFRLAPCRVRLSDVRRVGLDEERHAVADLPAENDPQAPYVEVDGAPYDKVEKNFRFKNI